MTEFGVLDVRASSVPSASFWFTRNVTNSFESLATHLRLRPYLHMVVSKAPAAEVEVVQAPEVVEGEEMVLTIKVMTLPI